jgi:hypothetical protein
MAIQQNREQPVERIAFAVAGLLRLRDKRGCW